MSMTINTNIASLNAQRNLNNTQTAVQIALQRLSSGLRINSAKDDAAGLAISDRMDGQIKGMNQAVRNANDGVSLAQTAEGALAEVTNNLQRIRELAVQSANASNNAADRAALDAEVQQRLAEIDRVASQTSFNGQKVLDGTLGNATFQVGANVGETISVGMGTSVRTSSIGKTADYVGAALHSLALQDGQQGTGVTGVALTGANGTLSIAVGSGAAVGVGASAAGSLTGQTASSAYAKVLAINSAGIGGLTATADNTIQIGFTTVVDASYKLIINGVAIANGDYSAQNITGSQMASLINANQSATGVYAAYDSVNGNITLQASDGQDIQVTQGNVAMGANATTGLGLVTNAGGRTNNTVNAALTSFLAGHVLQSAKGTVHLTAAAQITVAGTAVADIGYGATNYALGNTALSSSNVTTVAQANATISQVDAALSTVDSLRGTLGAIQNRFQTVVASLTTTSMNVAAAQSQIKDADFASETAALTRGQILQQAGTTMLAQANSAPQQVLALLKNF